MGSNNSNNQDHIVMAKLQKKIKNRFLLSIAVSKRARQISEGAKPLIEFDDTEHFDPIKLAMREISEGLINIETRDFIDDEEELIEKLDKDLEEEIKKEEFSEESKKIKDKESKKVKNKSLAT